MHSKKAFIIFNQTAGIVAGGHALTRIEAYLQKIGYICDSMNLDRDFEKKVATYDFTDVEVVVAVGGDGTVRVAAQMILDYKLQIPMAIIPFGSANVVAASLGIPISIKKSMLLIENPHIQKVDVGRINNKQIFLVGLSIGYISTIVTQTPRKLKSYVGFLGYIIRFLFNNVPLRRLKFKIDVDGAVAYAKGNSLVIFNAVNIYGIKPKKVISIADGILNLYVIKNRNFIGLFKIALDFLLYHEPPHHLFMRDGKRIIITLNRSVDSCQIDGDSVKLSNKIEVVVLPQVLSVIMPKA